KSTPCKSPTGDHYLLRTYRNKVDYCRIHGYDIFYNNVLLDPMMTGGWGKLPAVRAAMLAHPQAEWIWWLDEDTVITDMEYKISFHKADRELKEDMVIAIPNVKDDGEFFTRTNVGSKFQVKPKKPISQVVFKKNSASSSGTKKNSEVYRKVMSSTNPFDALNTIEEGYELGSNEGSSNSGKKVVLRCSWFDI
nr:galactosyl transferase [Tanacetum cinerariifolium]